MSNLFKEIKIGDLSVKNRIVMPPMCMYSATEGRASDFHCIHYGARALGGAGLIIAEATGVEACGRITDGCLGAYDDSHIEGLSRIAGSIKAGGAVSAIQLGHAGRKCTADVPEIYAPSAIAFDEKSKMPKEMSLQDIKRVTESFKAAAKRIQAAGFDMIEIHGAHGYMLSGFLSPLSNKRNDEYGGTKENRVRIVGEVIKAVREVFTGAVGLRVSAEDYMEGGNHPEDLAYMINHIKDCGIDLVDVSSGAVTAASFKIYPGYQLKFAEIIKEMTGLPVAAGGLLTSPWHMEEIIANKRADMVFVGRELLRNPHFPLYAAKSLGDKVILPKQYERAPLS